METSADSSVFINKGNEYKLKNSIFKKSNNANKNGFNVSLNESSSPTLGSITLTTTKKNPFAKAKRTNNKNLNVSASESLNESDSEKTCLVSKSKNLFGTKAKSSNNQFNVLFEDTTLVQNNTINPENQTAEELNSQLDEIRPNPFPTAKNQQKHLFNIEFDETKNYEQSQEISLRKLQIFQRPSQNKPNFTVSFDDSPTQCTQNFETSKKLSTDETPNASHIQRKKSLFNKNPDKSNNIFNADSDDSKMSDDEATNTVKNFNVSYATPTGNKENFEQPSGTLNSVNRVTRASRERQNSGGASAFDSENDSNNLSNEENCRVSRRTNTSSLTKNLSRNNNTTINSEVYNTQSSYNDDNLDNWMSAESDAEMSPPKIPPLQANFMADEEVSGKSGSTEKAPHPLFWEEKLNEIVSNASKRKHYMAFDETIKISRDTKKNTEKPDVEKKKTSQNAKNYQRTQDPTKLKKPAPYANKRLYGYIINKIKPKFGIDSYVKAEELVLSICDTVKIVTRKKDHQKKLIEKLKKEMAIAGLIETTVDFHEFVINFLPYNFRVKVVPCLQPMTNTIYPPRSTINPFDKIL